MNYDILKMKPREEPRRDCQTKTKAKRQGKESDISDCRPGCGQLWHTKELDGIFFTCG